MVARRKYLLNAFKLLDIGIMILVFVAAIKIPYHQLGKHVTFSQFIDMRVKVQNVLLFLGFVGEWHLSFLYFDLYRSRRLSQLWTESLDVLKATFCGTAVIAVASILFNVRIATPKFLLGFCLASTALTIGTRLGLRHALREIRRSGRNLRHLLIVGTNERSFEFARKILSRPELGELTTRS